MTDLKPSAYRVIAELWCRIKSVVSYHTIFNNILKSKFARPPGDFEIGHTPAVSSVPTGFLGFLHETSRDGSWVLV